MRCAPARSRSVRQGADGSKFREPQHALPAVELPLHERAAGRVTTSADHCPYQAARRSAARAEFLGWYKVLRGERASLCIKH